MLYKHNKHNSHRKVDQTLCIACMPVCIGVLFNVEIQEQTASQWKPMRHPIFYLPIRTHKV